MQRHCWIVVATVVGVLGGCPSENFPNAVDATRNDVAGIVESDVLDAQEKREDLAQLGFSPAAINALLRGERTGNQFGGSLTTAFEDVRSGRYRALTPDEVQIYTDGASDADADVEFTLTDAQAQAVVDLFDRARIDTADELAAFLEDPASDVPNTIPDDLLESVFVDFDPNDLADQLP